MSSPSTLSLVALLPLLAGCDYIPQSVGFFTTDNFGVNVSSAADVIFEVSYARREGVIEPGFEDGNVPTVAASVMHAAGNSLNFASASTAIFAGGTAARGMSGDLTNVSKSHEALFEAKIGGAACVAHLDTTPPPGRFNAEARKKLLFGTDTTIGFKIAIPAAAPTGQLPSVQLGYRRHEAAIAPIFIDKNGCLPDKAHSVASEGGGKLGDDDHPDAMRSPSFLAIISTGQGSDTGAGNFHVGQVFATGKAAEILAFAPGVTGQISATAASILNPAH